MKMKKSTIAILISTLTCSVGISALIFSKANSKQQIIEKEPSVEPAPFFINEGVEARDDVFGENEKSLIAGNIGAKSQLNIKKLDDENEQEDLSLTKPKIGYQYISTDSDNDGVKDLMSIRYTAAINSLDVDSAIWTRAMYDANGNVYSPLAEAEKETTVAYTGLSHNGQIKYATEVEDDLGNRPYNYFVVYTLLDIPLNGYSKYYLDASLTLTKGEDSITSSVGAVEIDISDSFSYERGTLSELFFSTKSDGTLSVTGENNNDVSEIVIPAYYNNGDGRYQVSEVEAGAFQGFGELQYLEIPDVQYVGGNIIDNPYTKLLLRSEEEKSGWDGYWNSSNNSTSFDYIGYHGVQDYLIYTISKDDNDDLYASVVGGIYIDVNDDDDSSNDVLDLEVADFMSVPATNIADYSFYNWEQWFEGFVLPATIKTIGENAFRGSCLMHIIGGDGVETIGDYAFANCPFLENVPNISSVKSIGDYAFSGCSMNLGGSNGILLFGEIEHIGDYAFSYCNSTKLIYLPDTLTSVGEHAFEYSTAVILCEATSKPAGWSNNFLGDELETYTYTVMWNCNMDYGANTVEADGLYYTIIELNNHEKVAILNEYRFQTSDVVVPSTINGATVIMVRDGVFSGILVRSVTLPDTVTKIGAFLFSWCEELEYVDLGGVIALEKGTFDHANILSTIVWSENLTTIKSYAFQGYCARDELILPDTITTIEPYAFYSANTDVLGGVFIPSSVTSIPGNLIEEDPFVDDFDYQESYLTFLCEASSKPSGWAKDWNFGLPAFWNSTYDAVNDEIVVNERNDLITDNDLMIQYYIENDEAHIYRYFGTADGFGVPDELDGYQVTSIGDYCCFGCSNIRGVGLPDTVKSIGISAFRGTSIRTFSGDFVEYVGDYAFFKCSNMFGCSIGLSPLTVGDYAFCGCSSVEYFDFLYIESIGSYAFYRCTSLDHFYIPNCLTHVGNNAFYESNISFICQPASKPNWWIDSNLFNTCYFFWDCLCLEEEGYVFPEEPVIFNDDNGIEYFAVKLNPTQEDEVRVEAIVNDASQATGDIEITEYVYDVVKIVGVRAHAFENYGDITNLVLPDTVTFAGEYAFAGAYNMESIDLGGIEVLQEGALEACFSLTNIVWSNNLTKIEDHALAGMEIIEKIILPNTVVEIGEAAFGSCNSLRTIFIPSSVSKISYNILTDEENYFPGNSELTIYCGANARPNTWIKHWNSGFRTVWGCSLVDGEIVY